MKMGKWSIVFAVALTLLSAYMLLDTFVIPEAYVEDASQSGQQALQVVAETESENSENAVTEESMDDDDTESPEIQLTTYRINDTNVYVADIVFSSVESVKTAFAQDTYGRKITDKTSDMAGENNAILAINGDYYGARESGYVIRNGVLYRSTPSDEDVLCIYLDGSMEIADPSEVSAEELLEAGAWQVFSFGPGLLENGEYLVDQNDEVGRAMASNPRTAIGMIDNNHYIFVVSDGRT